MSDPLPLAFSHAISQATALKVDRALAEITADLVRTGMDAGRARELVAEHAGRCCARVHGRMTGPETEPVDARDDDWDQHLAGTHRCVRCTQLVCGPPGTTHECVPADRVAVGPVGEPLRTNGFTASFGPITRLVAVGWEGHPRQAILSEAEMDALCSWWAKARGQR